MSYLIGSMTIGRFVGTIFLLLAEIPYSKPFKVVNLWQRTLATNSWSAYLGIRYLVSYWNEMDVSDWCFVSHPAKRLRQGMDVESDPVSHNLLSEIGFLKGLELTLRLMAFALFFGGLPCKSYTFISSATHQRSAVQPNGKTLPVRDRGFHLAMSLEHHGLNSRGARCSVDVGTPWPNNCRFDAIFPSLDAPQAEAPWWWDGSCLSDHFIMFWNFQNYSAW